MWKGIIMPWGKELSWKNEAQPEAAVSITGLELPGDVITNDEFEALSWEQKATLLEKQVAAMREFVGGDAYRPPKQTANATENVAASEPVYEDKILALIDETKDLAIDASAIMATIDELLVSS